MEQKETDPERERETKAEEILQDWKEFNVTKGSGGLDGIFKN